MKEIKSTREPPVEKPWGVKDVHSVYEVEYLSGPPAFIKKSLKKKAKNSRNIKRGLDYEKRVNTYFQQLYGKYYKANPWFRYKQKKGSRFEHASPDGLHFNQATSTVTIVEIKLSHTIKAWWQLRRLYQPILSRKLSGWDVRVLEIYAIHIKGLEWPEKVWRVQELEGCGEGYNLWQLSDRRLESKSRGLERDLE